MNPADFHNYITIAYAISAAITLALILQAWLRGKLLRNALLKAESASDEA